MSKKSEKKTVLFRRNWISLVLILMIFPISIYAQEPGTATPANVPGNDTAQSVTAENKEESPVTPETAPVVPATPAIKGNSKPDQATQASLDTILSSPYMPIDIMVGQQYLLTETDAFSFHGIVYVPLRSMVNLVPGSTLTWNQENLQADVTLPLNGTVRNLSFFANSTVYLDNGAVTALPAATLQKDGKMILPLSFMAEMMGIGIQQDKLYHVITLDTKDLVVNPAALGSRFYGPAEVKDLARLIYKEAGGTSYAAMHGVASVILNHVRHPLYPNTVAGVIFAVAPSGAPHYTPAHKPGFGSVIPNYHSILAAKKVLRGENSIGQAIFFNTRPFKNKTILTKINGIYFCY